MTDQYLYTVGDNLYLNLTNKCPCRCVFCIRDRGDGVNEGENLWLAHDPTLTELESALSKEDLGRYRQIVFCGYGEPTERIDLLVATARHIRETLPDAALRLDTNGLGNLINGRDIVPELAEVIDVVSVSLNAPDNQKYLDVTKPAAVYRDRAYCAMLDFAAECKKAGVDVKFTVVDVISNNDIKLCQVMSRDMGIPLRVRALVGAPSETPKP